jgi:hypothetical protein
MFKSFWNISKRAAAPMFKAFLIAESGRTYVQGSSNDI